MSEIQDEDLFITEIETPSEASDDDPEPAFQKSQWFLRHLPQVSLNEVPEDQRDCGICHERYGTQEHDEIIARLPCGHIVGLDCIYEWLKPSNRPKRNTCPYCRTVFFEIESPDSDEEDEEDEEDDEDEDDDITPELRELLDLNTLDGYVSALLFVEPIIKGRQQIPRGMSRTMQMLVVYQAFFDNQIVDLEFDAATVMDLELVKSVLSHYMGQLYVRFGRRMETMHMPIPWNEWGPRTEILSDPEMKGLIETGLYHFARAEHWSDGFFG